MDGGPFRASRPTERRVASRSEPAYRQSDEPQPNGAPQPARPVTTQSRPATVQPKQPRRLMWSIIITLLVIIVAAAGWFAWSHTRSTTTAIDSSKYQAVFFTNGQVYFGKLESANRDYLQLTDIYYLQTQTSEAADPENPQATSTDQNNVQLIKLGDEIHGPEDKMMISKDQVLFYENLKADGKVAQSISKFKKP